ncbi:MAG: class I SAM-dependent methyltransferase [Burkholderiales bacterium]
MSQNFGAESGVMQPQHELTAPSDWVCRFVKLIPAGGTVLDVACGSGRHARLLAGLGYRVEAVDRDESLLQGLRGVERVSARTANLEGGPWPYASRQFAGIIVCNYLHRPLFPRLLDALEPEGVLIYETFAVGNERFGKPSNPDFLLKPGELLEVVRGQLRVIAYEDLFVAQPKPAMVQRICARRDYV